jgi:hypothetical protein
MAERENDTTAPDPVDPAAAATLDQVCLALWGISERLDEQNRLTAARTGLLREVGTEAVEREIEAVKRETDRLKLFMTSRDDVLDEVQNSIDDLPNDAVGRVEGDPVATLRALIERMRAVP